MHYRQTLAPGCARSIFKKNGSLASAGVQLFAEDSPLGTNATSAWEMPLGGLPAELHVLSAIATTTFGELVTSPARQAGVHSST